MSKIAQALNSLSEAIDAELQSFKEDNKALKKDNKMLKNDIVTLMEHNHSFKEDNKALKKDNKMLKKSIEQLQYTTVSLTKRVEQLESYQAKVKMRDMCKEYRQNVTLLFGDLIPAGNPDANKTGETRRAWWGHKKDRFDRFADEVEKLIEQKDQRILQRLKDFGMGKADLLACLKLNQEKEQESLNKLAHFDDFQEKLEKLKKELNKENLADLKRCLNEACDKVSPQSKAIFSSMAETIYKSIQYQFDEAQQTPSRKQPRDEPSQPGSGSQKKPKK